MFQSWAYYSKYILTFKMELTREKSRIYISFLKSLVKICGQDSCRLKADNLNYAWSQDVNNLPIDNI